MTAPTFPDDADELAAISTTIRPIVDAGKGRALALEIVRVVLVMASSTHERGSLRSIFSDWYVRAINALAAWHARALDIDTGRENEPPPPCDECNATASCKHRHIRPPYTLLDVAGIAERIASMARHTPMFQPMGQERLIVYDLATALRRACECSADRGRIECLTCGGSGNAEGEPCTDCLGSGRDWNSPEWEHTAAVLLPLLIRDLRRLCTSARVDPAPIEAAIARFGGTPS